MPGSPPPYPGGVPAPNSAGAPAPYPGGVPGSVPPPPYGYQAGGLSGASYAGFGARLGGYLLDGLLYGLLSLVFVVPAFILGVMAFDDCQTYTDVDGVTSLECGPGELNGGLLAAAIVLAVIGYLVVIVIYIRALGRTGQTWGRKIVGVKVVGKESGQPLGVGKALGRTLIEVIVSGNCILGYLWMLWDRDKQTWHDKIVSSVVVRV